jgi:hypothetical protein
MRKWGHDKLLFCDGDTPELPPFQGEGFFLDIPRVETLG